jgi:hypothetical protein
MERIIPNPKARLFDQVREVMRFKHYSLRTEQTYLEWMKRFIFFHQKRHPREMGAPEVKAFLTDLAVHRQVAASTQNQALNALLNLIDTHVMAQPGIGIRSPLDDGIPSRMEP